jgi:hypothetical protein
MVKVIDGPVKEEEIEDAPVHEPDYKGARFLTTCPACADSFRETQDLKYTGKNAWFIGAYIVSDKTNRPFRVYYCPMHHIKNGVDVGSVTFAAEVHFKRCPYKDVLVEYDTELGQTHYVTCLEPDFKCDRSRKDLPPHHWFCETLDKAPVVRFMDVYSSPWFEKMGRTLLDEALVSDQQELKKWLEKRISGNR